MATTMSELRPWVSQAVLDDAIAKTVVADEALDRLSMELRSRVSLADGGAFAEDAERPTGEQVGQLTLATAMFALYVKQMQKHVEAIAFRRDEAAFEMRKVIEP